MASNDNIDWNSLYELLRWDSEAHRSQSSADRLRQRARQYATPLRGTEPDADLQVSVLTFKLGRERYAVDVAHVRGVRASVKVTRVPGAPTFYRGVVNLRGQIISVIDLRLLFGIGIDEGKPANELIVVRAKGLVIGLSANHIEGLEELPQKAFHPVEEVRYVQGVTVERLVMLDIESMLGDRRLIVSGRNR